MIWLQAIPPGICYALFHCQFFRCVESILKIPPIHKRDSLLTLLINYSIFILCSAFNFHLIVNWIIFLFLLLVEQRILYRVPVDQCLLFALLGTQLGLAINILCRSLVAILLDMPLISFDNSVLNPHNMKLYPILLGFLVAGALFFLVARLHLLDRLNLALADRKTLLFFLCLMIAMYFYLCMNLMVYYVPENNLILKLWSMKSSLFVIMGECLAVILSIRLGQIAVYRAQSQASQEQLTKEQLRERELYAIAATDPLTCCENRLQARPRLKEALDVGRVFCLCFVDMNRLKSVNDQFGHGMGDQYIQAVSSVLRQICGREDSLFRYGGDEFILLLFNTTMQEADARLQKAQQALEAECQRCAYPFTAGISYGIATPDDSGDDLELIKTADARMYAMKQAGRQGT